MIRHELPTPVLPDRLVLHILQTSLDQHGDVRVAIPHYLVQRVVMVFRMYVSDRGGTTGAFNLGANGKRKVGEHIRIIQSVARFQREERMAHGHVTELGLSRDLAQ